MSSPTSPQDPPVCAPLSDQHCKIGSAPGSIQHVGEVKVKQTSITLFDYDAEELIEVTFSSLEKSRHYQKQRRFYWLNIYGLHEPAVMQEIGQRFGLHPLVLEDIVNTHHRPKLEDYGDYVFLVLKSFGYDAAQLDCQGDQVSLVLGKDFVLSFQERPTGVFKPIRERIRKPGSLLRRSGPDALLHALVDAVVDSYFAVADNLSADVEKLEDALISNPPRKAVEQINHLKREMYELRHAIWPTREVLNGLLRHSGGLIQTETVPYFRDVYEHCVHIIEQLDSLRELIGDLLDLHLSSVSHRLNAEVRVLTIVTTLFAPATVITGFFGMNFHSMPWLDQANGWELAVISIVLGGLALLGVLLWRQRRIRRGFS